MVGPFILLLNRNSCFLFFLGYFKIYIVLFLSFVILFEYAGNLGFFSSRVSPAPPGDMKKEAPVNDKDGTKSCCGCLGKDTIANAAARVGPAVVNLSVPQGIYFFAVFIFYAI